MPSAEKTARAITEQSQSTVKETLSVKSASTVLEDDKADLSLEA